MDPGQLTFSQAMSGKESAKYWKACEKEYNMLENKMEAWKVVDRDNTMNVLPGIWALRKKRRPDGSVVKFKARFYV